MEKQEAKMEGRKGKKTLIIGLGLAVPWQTHYLVKTLFPGSDSRQGREARSPVPWAHPTLRAWFLSTRPDRMGQGNLLSPRLRQERSPESLPVPERKCSNTHGNLAKGHWSFPLANLRWLSIEMHNDGNARWQTSMKWKREVQKVIAEECESCIKKHRHWDLPSTNRCRTGCRNSAWKIVGEQDNHTTSKRHLISHVLRTKGRGRLHPEEAWWTSP